MIRRAEQGGSLRKVAILVRALDSAAAERLLSAMSTADAAEVRALAARLDDCSSQESAAVLSEFLRATGRTSGRSGGDSGVELELSATVQTTTESQPAPNGPGAFVASDATTSRRSRPLHFVSIDEAPRVAMLLEREGDAVGAALLAMLEPDVAARVLEALTLERQRTLLARLAKTGRLEPMIVEELCALVREHLEATAESDDDVGFENVQAILGQVDHHRREQLFGSSATGQGSWSTARSTVGEPVKREELLSEDSSASERSDRFGAGRAMENLPETSLPRESHEARMTAPSSATAEDEGLRLSVEQQQELQRRFDGLGDWSEEALLGLLKRVPPRVLRIAMVGSSPKLIRRVLRPLRRADAERLRTEWERPGAVRLSDIATAQRAILLLAGRPAGGRVGAMI